MNKNILLIVLFFAVMLFTCFRACGQSHNSRIPATDINKKTADEALTDSLIVFQCRHNNTADSIYNNLFGHYTKRKTIPLGILHRRYGSVPPEINISFADFICMFMDDFDFYCAVDEKKNQALNITLVLKHKSYDYIHMLLIHSSQQDFANGDKLIKADFYTYIPQYSAINNKK